MSRNRVIRNNKHHRLARSRSGGIPVNGEVNGKPNVIVVNVKDHEAFHRLFQNTDPVEIARVLNEKWVDPNYTMLALDKSTANKVRKLLKQVI